MMTHANHEHVTTALETIVIDELDQAVGGGGSGLPTSRPYTVQEGDTLTKIANKSGLTLHQIIEWNPQFQDHGRGKPNLNLIHPGDIIIRKRPDDVTP